MAITRWDPFREVVALQNRVNSLFREMNEGDSPLTTASFVPAVDIYEDAEKGRSEARSPGNGREGPGHPRGKPHANRERRAQI